MFRADLLSNPIYCQNLFLLCALILAFLLQTDLLIRCLMVRIAQNRLSTNVLINIAMWSVTTLEGICYIGLLVFKFDEKKSGLLLLCLGILFSSCTWALSLSIMFLMLDRIYALIFPFNYKKHHSFFVWLTIVTCLVVPVIFFSATLYNEWPVVEITECNGLLCFMKPSSASGGSLAKILLGFVNLAVSFFFKLTISKFENCVLTESQFKKANFLAWSAFASELLFIFVPQLLIIFSNLLEIPLWQKFGSYGFFFLGLDSICTSIIYRFIIRPSIFRSTSCGGGSSFDSKIQTVIPGSHSLVRT